MINQISEVTCDKLEGSDDTFQEHAFLVEGKISADLKK